MTTDVSANLVPYETSDPMTPRRPTGVGTQHFISTLVGQFSLDTLYPTAFFVDIMGGFGASESGVRNALARLVTRGLLISVRTGKTTRFRVSDPAKARHHSRLRHILSFGSEPSTWDGSWTVVLFSVPEGKRDLRHMLRRQLDAIGFAPLYDGAWVSPSDRAQFAHSVLKELGVPASTVMVATYAEGATAQGAPINAFDLAARRATYDDFIARYTPLRARTLRGEVAPAEALLQRTELLENWREFADRDQYLPQDLLPGNWPLRAARQLFCEIHDELGPIAQTQVVAALRRTAPDFSGEISFFSTDMP